MNRILWNPGRDEIDEVVLHNAATVHIEQMDDSCWWIGVTLTDGSYWAGNFHSYPHAMTFTEQESDVAWEKDEEHA